jgi:hypothetical protein
MTCGIYKITSPSGNCYVGQSVNIEKRWMAHRYSVKKERHNRAFTNAVKKYGIDSFVFEILEECSVDELTDREQFWMDKLKPKYCSMKSQLRRNVAVGRAKITHTSENNEWRVVTTKAGDKGEFHSVQFRGQRWVQAPSLAAGIYAADSMSAIPLEELPMPERQKIINIRRITTSYNAGSL